MTSKIKIYPVSSSDIPLPPSESSRLQLHQFAVMCPLRLKLGLAHLDRQLMTVGKPLTETFLPCFVLEMFISLIVQLLMLLHKVPNSLIQDGQVDVGHVPLLVL